MYQLETKILLLLLSLTLNLAISFDCFSATSVTQHGITWTFADDETCGQFVNGDYWCVGPVSITNISPGYTSTPRAMNGSMLNPDTNLQGYDGFTGSNYTASNNVGIGISVGTPLIITGDNSLVSTISNETCGDLGGGVHVSYVNSAAVLTILTSAPPDGSFRPGISSETKTLHNESSVNYTRLKQLSSPIAKPSISTYAGYLQMVWLAHCGDWGGRYMHPSASGMDNYLYSATFSEAALILLLDYTNEDKRDLLINYIQLGIDLNSYLEAGNYGWPPDGGHSSGRKWPILFAGIMLDYAPMKNIGQVSGNYLYANGHGPGDPPADYKYFGEDGQTFYVSQSDVDITNGGTWNPASSPPTYPYSSAMIGMPEWGIRYSTNQNYSNSAWSSDYRFIGSGGPIWAGTTIAARLMGAKTLWNYDAQFDYVDRYMAITNGDADPFGYTVSGQVSGNRPTGLIGAMYDTYRNYTPGTKYKLKSITQETP